MHGAVERIIGGKGRGLMWKRWTPSIIVPNVFLKGAYEGSSTNFWWDSTPSQSSYYWISIYITLVEMGLGRVRRGGKIKGGGLPINSISKVSSSRLTPQCRRW